MNIFEEIRKILEEQQIAEHKIFEETIEPFCQMYHMGALNALFKAIDRVEKLEKEYNNGWILCGERLPELTAGIEYFKQSECCLVAVKWWDGEISEDIGWYNQNGIWNVDDEMCRVVAWQPLPQPYKEGK